MMAQLAAGQAAGLVICDTARVDNAPVALSLGWYDVRSEQRQIPVKQE